MVGLGGVFVELLRDVSLELAPLSPEGARAMIGRLKAAKLLTGFRGRAASDVEALSDVLVRVAAMCCALGDRLVSLDLNPVMVLPEGEGVRIVDIVMQVAPARHCGETD
jgi:acyl-CoA synthetase (NDP forming)